MGMGTGCWRARVAGRLMAAGYSRAPASGQVFVRFEKTKKRLQVTLAPEPGNPLLHFPGQTRPCGLKQCPEKWGFPDSSASVTSNRFLCLFKAYKDLAGGGSTGIPCRHKPARDVRSPAPSPHSPGSPGSPFPLRPTNSVYKSLIFKRIDANQGGPYNEESD